MRSGRRYETYQEKRLVNPSGVQSEGNPYNATAEARMDDEGMMTLVTVLERGTGDWG